MSRTAHILEKIWATYLLNIKYLKQKEAIAVSLGATE
jgi:hypothetical protein